MLGGFGIFQYTIERSHADWRDIDSIFLGWKGNRHVLGLEMPEILGRACRSLVGDAGLLWFMQQVLKNQFLKFR